MSQPEKNIGGWCGLLKKKAYRFVMKILFVETFCHWKNKIGFNLLCNENSIESTITDDPHYFQEAYDLVLIPSTYIPCEIFPNSKVLLYGPHNFVFTHGIWKGPQENFPSHCVYNLLSDWIIKIQEEFGGMSIKPVSIPFPVDVQTFSPLHPQIEPRYDCFIYFKGRNQELLSFAESALKTLGLRYTILRYKNHTEEGSYTEKEYLDILRSSKFGIWIGCHESQGFALQEALSTNIPLVVWNVKSMFDEYNRENKISYKEDQRVYKLKATSVPYWDKRCGEVFYEKSEFTTKVLEMNESYRNYAPREFILETLSPKACYQRLVDILSTIPENPHIFPCIEEQAQHAQ